MLILIVTSTGLVHGLMVPPPSVGKDPQTDGANSEETNPSLKTKREPMCRRYLPIDFFLVRDFLYEL